MRLVPKLALAIALVFASALALVEYAEIRHERNLMRDDAVADLQLLAATLGTVVEREWSAEGEGAASRLLGYVESPRVRVRFRRSDEGPEPADPERIQVAVPIRFEGRAVGSLELSESMRPLREHLEQRLMRLSLIDLALLITSVVVAFVVADRVAGARLGRLVEQVRRIGAGDLGSRVDPSGRDEIAVLGRHINAMAEQLAASRAELESAHAERVEALAGLRHSDRLASVGRLASAMAHELGTPLNVVLARAKLVAAGEAVGDEVRRNAEIIAQQVQRMTQTLGGVLGFARGGSARGRVDLRDVARDTLRLLEPLARRRGVTLDLAVPETGVCVNARRQELEQVVINLLNNALDAVARGGRVSVAVDRALEPDERAGAPGRPRDWARVAVRDDGVGIPPERLARLFEPFYTTKQEGRGTGLGLWIADGIVREHGGEIEVESRVAGGSCFRVKLPAEGTA